MGQPHCHRHGDGPRRGAVTYSATGLPSGAHIDSASGIIAGLLDAQGDGVHHVTVTVSDGSLSTSASLTWTVYPPLTITPSVNNSSPDPGQAVQFSVTV